MPPRRAKRSAAELAADAIKKAKSYVIADDADEVLLACRTLKAKLRQETLDKQQQQQQLAAAAAAAAAASHPDEVTSSSSRTDILEVAELKSSEVQDGMEVIALQIASQVMHKQGFKLEIPSRAASNQVYIQEWDRIVLGSKRGTRSFLNVKVCLLRDMKKCSSCCCCCCCCCLWWWYSS